MSAVDDFFDSFLLHPVGSTHQSALNGQEHGANHDWRAEALARSPWIDDPWGSDDDPLSCVKSALPHGELLISDQWPDAEDDERRRQQRQLQLLTEADDALSESIDQVVDPERWQVQADPAHQRTKHELSVATADAMALVAEAEAATRYAAAHAAAPAAVEPMDQPVSRDVAPASASAPKALAAAPAAPPPARMSAGAAEQAQFAALKAEAAEMEAAHDVPFEARPSAQTLADATAADAPSADADAAHPSFSAPAPESARSLVAGAASVTADGYHSGIGSLPEATSAALVQARDVSELDELYDRSASWSLGCGANGAVSTVVKRATGVKFALKTMPPDETVDDAHEALQRLLADVEIQRGLDHPNILRVLDLFVDHHAAEVHFVMPLCSGGSVVDYLQRFASLTEGTKATLMHKMLSAVHYCHQHGIMHRDLKLENFVFDTEAPDAELKLIDFGMAVRVAPGAETCEGGFTTLLYTAPEMHQEWHMEQVRLGRKEPADGDVTYTSAIDVWALGVIAYQLLCGCLPFGLGEDPSEDDEIMVDRIIFEPLGYPEALDGQLSEEARAFCAALLERDPARRPNAQAAMQLAWIRQASQLRADAPLASGSADADTDNELGARERHAAIVRSLVAFGDESALRKHAYHAAAFTAPSSASQIKALRKAFVEADTDNSGTVSKAELMAVLAKAPELAAAVDTDALFTAIAGTSGNTEIEWRWFLAATLGAARGLAGVKPLLSSDSPTLIDTFLLLDRDRDGFVDAADLAELFAQSADDGLRALGASELTQLIRDAQLRVGRNALDGSGTGMGDGSTADQDGDGDGMSEPLGRLNFGAFKRLVLQPCDANAAAADLSSKLQAASRSTAPAPGAATPLDRARAAAAKRDAARLFKRAEADETKQGRVAADQLVAWAKRHFAAGLPEGESGLDKPPEEWVAAVVRRFDSDGDGMLSKAEFGVAINALDRSGWHAPSVA